MHRLDAQGVVWWDGTAMPRAFTEEYTKLAAGPDAASSFGKAVDPAVVALLEGRVRKGAMTISGHDIAVEAVMAVHNDLVARGWARWTTFDIPDAATMPYEMLAASNFGRGKANANDVVQAQRALASIIALPTSGERVQAEYF